MPGLAARVKCGAICYFSLSGNLIALARQSRAIRAGFDLSNSAQSDGDGGGGPNRPIVGRASMRPRTDRGLRLILNLVDRQTLAALAAGGRLSGK